MTPLNIKYTEYRNLEEAAKDEDDFDWYKIERVIEGVEFAESLNANLIAPFSKEDIINNNNVVYIPYITYDKVGYEMVDNDEFTPIDVFLTKSKAENVISLINLYREHAGGFMRLMGESAVKRKKYVELMNIEMEKFGGNAIYIRGNLSREINFTGENGKKKSIVISDVINECQVIEMMTVEPENKINNVKKRKIRR